MKISIDTRTIEPGDIFIPIKGPNFDGHDFIKDAIKRGARILDVNIEEYAKKYRKKLKCKVIGITGSAGKTTVKDMLFYVLSEKYKVSRTHENENNEIGVPLTILKADSDTDILIVEMAIRRKGEMKRHTSIVCPDYVVITNIGLTHAELMKTQKDIAKAKAEIFKKPLSWQKSNRKAFLNFGSEFYPFLKKKAEAAQFTVLPFEGIDKPDSNINLCYKVAKQFGLSDEQISNGLNKFKPSSKRLNISQRKEIKIIDDSYNANPDGVIFAIEYMSRFKGRKILVLGSMLELGVYSKKEHLNVLENAIESGFSCVFTYGKEFLEIETKDWPVYKFESKDKMHKQLLGEIKQGDNVLIKGSRGMKMEETVELLKNTYE